MEDNPGNKNPKRTHCKVPPLCNQELTCPLPVEGSENWS